MPDAAARAERAVRDARVVRSRTSVIERFRRIVAYRELLVGMTRKELKVKYKNSILGLRLVAAEPAALPRRLLRRVREDPRLAASRSSRSSCCRACSCGTCSRPGSAARGSSVVANAGLVKKVAFPREILPLAAVGSMLVHFFLQSMVLFAVLAVVRWDRSRGRTSPLLPLALVALLLLTGALGILLSAINVYLRDTQHFLELALLAWFWMTPIVYGFMTIGRRGSWFAKVFMLQPGHADRADLPARALRQARQPEGADSALIPRSTRSCRTGR